MSGLAPLTPHTFTPGDLSREQETLLLAALAARRVRAAEAAEERKAAEQRASGLLAALAAIRAATGATTLTAIADIFLTHPTKRWVGGVRGASDTWQLGGNPLSLPFTPQRRT